MRLIKLLEGICIRKDGESDEDFLTRCGNALQREPDMYNDRETSNIKLQKLMAKKKLPKDMKWNQGFELENINVRPEDKEMISGIIDMLRQVKDLNNRKQMAFDRLRDFKKEKIKVDTDEFLKQCGLKEDGMPGGAFVGLTSPQGYINGAPSQKKKKKKQEEDIVNDNEIDRNDMLLQKLTKAVIKAKQKGDVLEGHKLNCPKCGHTWESEEGGQDETICHKCGHNLYSVNEETEEDWMARKTQEILNKYKENRLKGLKESDFNKPSPKLRPEPHPTRHETEHPSYEKAAMKVKGKFTPPTKK